MAIDATEVFNIKKDWKLLFTRHDKLFRYKRCFNRDQEVLKPLRIDWFLLYYFWQFIITLTMFLMKPLYRMYYEHYRYREGEEITLTGRELRFTNLRYYRLK